MVAHHESPLLSIIIPVRNSPSYLRACLKSLQASTFKNYEIIVVDDASTDQTSEVATEMGVRLLRLKRQAGPAGARNRGAEIARGDYLFFLDADVCVHPETVKEIVKTFDQDPRADAMFGSYDAQPGALNVLSQYRNLFHHFVHQDANQHACTFWAGCGAIRRSVFLEMKGFDANYSRPCIEDIELGIRLHKAGRRTVVNKKVQATHLKKWTFWSILKTDVMDRGIPWTQLILKEGALPDDLNLKSSQRICVVLAYGLLALLGIGAWYYHGLLLLPVLAALGILLVDLRSLDRRVPTTWRVGAVVAVLGVFVLISSYFKMWALVALAFLLGIVLLNYRFYVFFARERHPLFAALVFPMHVLYFLYCGAAFGVGLWLHVWRNKISGRRKREPVKKTETVHYEGAH